MFDVCLQGRQSPDYFVPFSLFTSCLLLATRWRIDDNDDHQLIYVYYHRCLCLLKHTWEERQTLSGLMYTLAGLLPKYWQGRLFAIGNERKEQLAHNWLHSGNKSNIFFICSSSFSRWIDSGSRSSGKWWFMSTWRIVLLLLQQVLKVKVSPPKGCLPSCLVAESHWWAGNWWTG